MSVDGSISFAPCTLGLCALLLVVAFVAMRSAVRIAFAVGDVVRERVRCRRRGAIAAIAAIVAFVVVPSGCIGPSPAIVLTVAAVDCWLALLSSCARASTLPRATVLSRGALHVRAR